jgi:hypothetical protein
MSKQTDLINIPDAITVDGDNVGIGTDSPSADLHIASGSENAPHILLENTVSSGADPSITFADSVENYGYRIGIDDTGNGLAFTYKSGGINPIHGVDSERMRIDSSGNVGIGTDNPGAKLSVNSSSALEQRVVHNSNGTTVIRRDGTASYILSESGATTHRELILGSQTSSGGTIQERMRIDSTGNVLIGTSTQNAYGATFREGSKYLYLNRDGGTALFVDRGSSDGGLIEFRKNGSNIGVIGTVSNDMYLGTDNTGWRFINSARRIVPIDPSAGGTTIDNIVDLGDSGGRFDDIYATNGTIQTSDFNEKQDIASLTATEMLVGKRISALFKTFRWKDSVAEKGDNARTHTGVIAQDVQAAFTAEGLDAGDYALFISSTWWEHDVDVPAVEAVEAVDAVTETTTDEDGNEVVTVITEAVEAVEAKDAYTRTDTYDTEDEAPEGATERTRLGIRYPELLSFVAAYNEQRFASIEARLTALEA